MMMNEREAYTVFQSLEKKEMQSTVLLQFSVRVFLVLTDQQHLVPLVCSTRL